MPSVDRAVEALDAHGPDVLVSDIAMPERDGYELIRYVAQLERHAGRQGPGARADRVRAHRGSQPRAARRLPDARGQAGGAGGAGGDGGLARAPLRRERAPSGIDPRRRRRRAGRAVRRRPAAAAPERGDRVRRLRARGRGAVLDAGGPDPDRARDPALVPPEPARAWLRAHPLRTGRLGGGGRGARLQPARRRRLRSVHAGDASRRRAARATARTSAPRWSTSRARPAAG